MLSSVKVMAPTGWPSTAARVLVNEPAVPVGRFDFGIPASSTTTRSSSLAVFEDSYENHEPTLLPPVAAARQLLDQIAPIRTHERVISDLSGSVFGLEVGVTLSQLDLVRKNTEGVELIHVVNPDGSSNVETVLGRLPLANNHRIELQGPAFNTTLEPGTLPLGARFVGIGVTSDATSAMDHDAVSYTVEVKLTDKGVAELAALGGPGAASIAASALEDALGTGAATVVSDAILGAVPLVSAGLAVASAHRAWHVLHDDTASQAMKSFAVAHCLGDSVRVVAPLVGTALNAGLVGVAAVCGWVHMRHATHDAPLGPQTPANADNADNADDADNAPSDVASPLDAASHAPAASASTRKPA